MLGLGVVGGGIGLGVEPVVDEEVELPEVEEGVFHLQNDQVTRIALFESKNA